MGVTERLRLLNLGKAIAMAIYPIIVHFITQHDVTCEFACAVRMRRNNLARTSLTKFQAYSLQECNCFGHPLMVCRLFSFAMLYYQEPITWSLQLLHIPFTAFLQTDLSIFEFRSNSDPHRNSSGQLLSQAPTNVDM